MNNKNKQNDRISTQGEVDLFADIQLVNPDLKTHRENLRRDLLRGYNKSSEATKNTKNSILEILFAKRLVAGLFALLVILLLLVTNLGLGIDLNTDPAGPSEVIKVNTKEQLLVKAQSVEDEKLQKGKYRKLDYDIDIFSSIGELREYRVSYISLLQGNNSAEAEEEFFTQIQIIDRGNGKTIYASKIGTLSPESDYLRKDAGVFADQEKMYYASENYPMFMQCQDCTNEELSLMNANMPFTSRTRLDAVSGGIDLNNMDSCSLNDGARVVIECFGKTFISNIPALVLLDGQYSPIYQVSDMTTFQNRAELAGFDEVLAGNPELNSSIADDKLYQLFLTPNLPDEISGKARDHISALQEDSSVRYIGERIIGDETYYVLEYESEDITGKYSQQVGFNGNYELGYISRYKYIDGEKVQRYVYKVDSMTYQEEPERFIY